MASKVQIYHDDQVTSKQESSKPTVPDTAAITEHRHPATIIQRAKFDPRSLSTRDVLQLQRTMGNQAVQRLLLHARTDDFEARPSTKEATRLDHVIRQIPAHPKSPSTVQAKLDVSAPTDIYEQEADRVSDQVMTTLAHPAVNDTPPPIQRFSGQSTGQMDAVPASVDQTLAGPGRPLEPALRQNMGHRFGYDFSRLRVHSGIATAPGELEQPPFRLSARAPTTLPAATPAWTRNGEINLGPAGLFLAPQEQRRMLRHEAFHRLHQRIAPVSDAADARAEAERLAANAESGFGANSLLVPMAPAPALLAFPPQAHAPWDQVWIGDNLIIGAVTEGGVAARIILSYQDIGITRAPESQTYHCGKHNPAPIPALVARMRKAAKQAAALNNKIPQKDYALRTAVIAISKGANSAFRVAGGQGVLVVKQEEPWEGTIAHEGSHGIFAFHLGDRVKQGAPDSLAKGIAELFLELKNTTAVSIPTGKFDPKHLPPLKDDGQTATQAAGIVMVTDVLWSGSGGHPWDNVDEFFASAFGAYQQKSLFEKIVKHYGKADAKIPPLAKKLFALLAKVGDPKALAALGTPANTTAIDTELKGIQPTREIVAGLDAATDLLVNPNTLRGPGTISCPGAKPSGTGAARKAEPASQEDERLQAQRVGSSGLERAPVPPIVHGVLRSPGQPLDPKARTFMEPRFGHDFSSVLVHADQPAARSAEAVGAQAYTVGSNVVFGSGRYAPAGRDGQRLLAHELAHVVQQRGLPTHIQRQPSGAGSAATQGQAIAEFEADRRRFEQAQEEHFESIGEIVREHLLKAAGFVGGQRLTTPDEALTVVGMWGLTLNTLTTQLPHLSQSISGQVQGRHASATVAQQQQTLIAALTAQGQKAFQQMLTAVRGEPFWKQHLDTQDIFIFPDLTGANRYAGYTQRGTGQTAEGLTKPVFVIHISKNRLEASQVDESVATLIHELGHTLHEPNLVSRSLKPFTNSLAELLADHPKIAAMRQGAKDAAEARQIYISRISQILYEHTGYGEAEIFAHLQQLTHQPPVPAGGQSIPGGRFILAQVEAYAEKLRRIGLPPRMLSGILRTLARRVALLYDRRIAAAPQGSNQRRLLEINKDQALAILGIAAGE